MVCVTCTFWSWAVPLLGMCSCQHSCLASVLDVSCQRSHLAYSRDSPVQDAVELTPGPSLVKAKLALTPHSLDRLLSYHDDNTKEAAFEVALFAEMFLEMLQVWWGWGEVNQGHARGMEQLHARGVEACGSTSSQMPGNVRYIQR